MEKCEKNSEKQNFFNICSTFYFCVYEVYILHKSTVKTKGWIIARPMATGRARVHKTSEQLPIFQARTFYLKE